MRESFRLSMSLLHTWSGLVLGAVLFAVFWMGTLSVFDREIDRWTMPATRLEAPPADVSLDRNVRPVAEALASGASQWYVSMATPRSPALELGFTNAAGEFEERSIDPRTGQALPESGSHGGTGFIFPFHYSLNLAWMGLGYWLVGLAGIAMLVLLVSGVVIHRKIFVDFFTFRPRGALPRSTLDLHNLTGVLALPFHFVMSLSGLLIFYAIYFAPVASLVYRDNAAAFERDAYGSFAREPAKAPGTLGSLDAMAATAEREWHGGRVNFVRVWNFGDANSYVEMRRSVAEDVSYNLDTIYFDAATGTVLERFTAKPVMRAETFLAGLHLAQFDRWTLRWLYFASGLAGCVLIATGYIYWVESRRKRLEKLGMKSLRVVEGLAVGATTGMVIATLAFFVVNRVLPTGGAERASHEEWAFYTVWIATFAHGWIRSSSIRRRRVWVEQTWAIAALAAAAVVANWASTGDHLARTLARGDWAVAGMDLVLAASAALAAWAAMRTARGRARAGAADRFDAEVGEVSNA